MDEPCSSCEGLGWVQWEESTDRTKYPCPNCQAGRDYAFSQTYNRNHPMTDAHVEPGCQVFGCYRYHVRDGYCQFHLHRSPSITKAKSCQL